MPLEEKPRRQSISAPAPFGFYHKVQKGQTLWRIAGLYGIDIDELMKYNNLREGAALGIGQPVFIPRSSRTASATSSPSIVRAPAAAPGVSEDFIWPMKGKVLASFG